MSFRAFAIALLLLGATVHAVSSPPRAIASAPAQDAPALARQVYTIFEAKCTECHAADLPRPKGDFDYVLDLAALAANPDYIVPGKPEQSELYLMIENDEMPGEEASVPPLTDAEKVTVKKWIEIGAPSVAAENKTRDEVSPSPFNTGFRATRDLPFGKRLIRALGQFHPPSSHFPIALLIAALPAEFMWKMTRKRSWKATVRFCVTLGAACAVFTAALGWCGAAFTNYTGTSASLLAWHRWVGTATALWAVLTAILSELAHKEQYPRSLRYTFRAVLALGILLVSASGYLGATLIYGPRHFRW